MTERVLLINDDAFELATLAAAMRLHGVNIIGEASNYIVAENLFKNFTSRCCGDRCAI